MRTVVGQILIAEGDLVYWTVLDKRPCAGFCAISEFLPSTVDIALMGRNDMPRRWWFGKPFPSFPVIRRYRRPRKIEQSTDRFFLSPTLATARPSAHKIVCTWHYFLCLLPPKWVHLWNKHNTVFGSKAIRAQALYFLHLTMPSVACLRLSDVSVICRVTYIHFQSMPAFLPYSVSKAAQQRSWFTIKWFLYGMSSFHTIQPSSSL